MFHGALQSTAQEGSGRSKRCSMLAPPRLAGESYKLWLLLPSRIVHPESRPVKTNVLDVRLGMHSDREQIRMRVFKTIQGP
jgi:hypothetical protein